MVYIYICFSDIYPHDEKGFSEWNFDQKSFFWSERHSGVLRQNRSFVVIHTHEHTPARDWDETLLNVLMKPKRLGDFAQAKHEERNETVPRGPGLRGLDDSRWKTKRMFCVKWISKITKISRRYFRFLPGYRKYFVFCDGSPAEMSTKSSFWKPALLTLKSFCADGAFWVHEGAEMLPSEEYIGSHSEFPSFRD